MEEIKFTDEELKNLKDLSDTYRGIQEDMGKLSVQKLLNSQQADALEQSELDLNTQYTENQKKERELVDTLSKKYGPGSLDASTGVFTPSPQQNVEENSEEK